MKLLVNQMRRGAFNRVQDLRQRPYRLLLIINEGNEDQVGMIRHHDSRSEVIAFAMIVHARTQDDIAGFYRQFPPLESAECDKVWLEVALKMR